MKITISYKIKYNSNTIITNVPLFVKHAASCCPFWWTDRSPVSFPTPDQIPFRSQMCNENKFDSHLI